MRGVRLLQMGTAQQSPAVSSLQPCRVAQLTGGVKLVSTAVNSSLVAIQQESHPYRRSHKCGAVAQCQEGTRVAAWGWVSSKRPRGTKLMFVTLRDHSGTVQLVFNAGQAQQLSSSTGEAVAPPAGQEEEQLPQELLKVNHETVVWVEGVVKARPEEAQRGQADSVELLVDSFKLLNKAVPLPVLVSELELSSKDGEKAKDGGSTTVQREEQRLRWRVPYLRTAGMQRRLRMRAKALDIMRSSLNALDFLEVDTPTLFRRTSEGAREFVVPSSSEKGQFYTLVQSPQQYKQLLMAGGVDRYFQIAKCYRDEALRSDRQPEFTQLDLEVSCVSQEELFSFMESMLKRLWSELLHIELPTPFLRMPFKEAMNRFGIDKPDTRFDMELCDVTSLLANHQFEAKIFGSALKNGQHIIGINAKGLAGTLSRKEQEAVTREAKRVGATGVTQVHVKADGAWKSSIAKHLDQETVDILNRELDATEGDMLLFGTEKTLLRTQQVMGFLRLYAAKLMQQKGLLTIPEDQFNFLWVVDFPLFTAYDSVMDGPHQGHKLASEFEATHHPFTAPVPEDEHLLMGKDQDKDAFAKVRGQHYDIVVNGMELGGGSIRIHDAKMQMRVLRDVLGISEELVNDQFRHLLESLSFGCPPHGGIAFGLDRMLALMNGVSSIRDVIAFPKAHSGRELLTGAPAPIPKEELNEIGITLYRPSK